MTLHVIERKAELAERSASVAVRTADRAFELARSNGDVVGAIEHAHREQAQLVGALAADVQGLRSDLEKHQKETTGALLRLELNAGTRTYASAAEKALAEKISLDARASFSDAETRKIKAKVRGEIVLRIFGAVYKLLGPAAVAISILLAAQVRGCVPSFEDLSNHPEKP